MVADQPNSERGQGLESALGDPENRGPTPRCRGVLGWMTRNSKRHEPIRPIAKW
nr:hypothetical protein [uncultured bacterium]